MPPVDWLVGEEDASAWNRSERRDCAARQRGTVMAFDGDGMRCRWSRLE